MLTWKQWTWGTLLTVFCAASALNGLKEPEDAKVPTSAVVSVRAEPVSPTSAPAALNGGSPNVTALLGVLVMKGVLAPGEANAIRNAAPGEEFPMLVEALMRKGVVSMDELAPLPSPTVKPVEPAQVPQTPRQVPSQPRRSPSRQ